MGSNPDNSISFFLFFPENFLSFLSARFYYARAAAFGLHLTGPISIRKHLRRSEATVDKGIAS